MIMITNDDIYYYNKFTEMTLRLLGLSSSYKGFHYLRHGIYLVIKNPNILTYICKGLYTEIAICHNTSVNCVERNIRTAKEVIWNNGSKSLLKDIFGNVYRYEIPSNAVFIDLLAFYIKNARNEKPAAPKAVNTETP